MKFKDFASVIRNSTLTSSSTFTDEEILRLANMYKDTFSQQIAETDEGVFGMPFVTSLVADQREYELPDEVIKIERVEAIVDGEDQKKYTSLDVASLNFELTETKITEMFKEKYFYSFFRKALFLYTGESVIDVVDGLLLRAIIWPQDFTDLESEVDMSVRPNVNQNGFPRQFHELLARRVIIHHKQNRDRPVPLTDTEQSFEFDFRKALDALRGTDDNREVIPVIPYNDGSNY